METQHQYLVDPSSKKNISLVISKCIGHAELLKLYTN